MFRVHHRIDNDLQVYGVKCNVFLMLDHRSINHCPEMCVGVHAAVHLNVCRQNVYIKELVSAYGYYRLGMLSAHCYY